MPSKQENFCYLHNKTELEKIYKNKKFSTACSALELYLKHKQLKLR